MLNLLLATDRLHNGVLFDMNADGHIGLVEMLVRAIANEWPIRPLHQRQGQI